MPTPTPEQPRLGQTTFKCQDLAALGRLASGLADALRKTLATGFGARIYLSGELGAGKTTLCQFLINRLCGVDKAPSPSYSLVNPYPIPGHSGLGLLHLDCYRLQGAGDLASLGVDGLDAPEAVLVVEWPERALDALPQADLWIHLRITARELEAPRELTVSTYSRQGEQLLRLAGPVC